VRIILLKKKMYMSSQSLIKRTSPLLLQSLLFSDLFTGERPGQPINHMTSQHFQTTTI